MHRQFSLHLLEVGLNDLWLDFGLWSCWQVAFWKVFPKTKGGGNLYDDSNGMFGFFLGASTKWGSSGVGVNLSPLIHSCTVSQSAGMPKKLLSQPEKRNRLLNIVERSTCWVYYQCVKSMMSWGAKKKFFSVAEPEPVKPQSFGTWGRNLNPIFKLILQLVWRMLYAQDILNSLNGNIGCGWSRSRNYGQSQGWSWKINDFGSATLKKF